MKKYRFGRNWSENKKVQTEVAWTCRKQRQWRLCKTKPQAGVGEDLAEHHVCRHAFPGSRIRRNPDKCQMEGMKLSIGVCFFVKKM